MIIRSNEQAKVILEDYGIGGFKALLKHPRCNGSFSLRDKMYLS